MKDNFEKFLNQIDKLGGDSRQLVFEKPASFSDILEIEMKLNYKLPDDFKNILITTTSHCEFKWFLPENFPLPNNLKNIFCGELHWGIDFIIPFNEDKDLWIKKVFPNVEDEYDKVWHNKFVFQEVGNGDYISIDLLPHNYGKVIYLSHDDGEGHGFIMANSFSELIINWTKLGCVGGEDWQWLPFCKNKLAGIDPDSDNGKLWVKSIGIV